MDRAHLLQHDWLWIFCAMLQIWHNTQDLSCYWSQCQSFKQILTLMNSEIGLTWMKLNSKGFTTKKTTWLNNCEGLKLIIYFVAFKVVLHFLCCAATWTKVSSRNKALLWPFWKKNWTLSPKAIENDLKSGAVLDWKDKFI